MPFFGYKTARRFFKKKKARQNFPHLPSPLAEQGPGSRAGRKGWEARGRRNYMGDPERSVARCDLLSAPRVGPPRIRANLARIQTWSPQRWELSGARPPEKSKAGSGLCRSVQSAPPG